MSQKKQKDKADKANLESNALRSRVLMGNISFEGQKVCVCRRVKGTDVAPNCINTNITPINLKLYTRTDYSPYK